MLLPAWPDVPVCGVRCFFLNFAVLRAGCPAPGMTKSDADGQCKV